MSETTHPQDKHDPGGKVRIKLPDYVSGTAVFSECGRFRQRLDYRWGKGRGTALVCGMNPSMADAKAADPTVAKVRKYVENMLGYEHLIMVNVLDARETHQKNLTKMLDEGLSPCSSANFPTILEAAREADKIVMACGNLHKKLLHFSDDITQQLLKAGHALYCFGVNKNGTPKHPLYQKDTAPLVPYLGRT